MKTLAQTVKELKAQLKVKEVESKWYGFAFFDKVPMSKPIVVVRQRDTEEECDDALLSEILEQTRYSEFLVSYVGFGRFKEVSNKAHSIAQDVKRSRANRNK